MKTEKEGMRKEYPEELIKSGVRGEHAQRFREGTKLVAIAPDLQAFFPDSAAVDKALREYLASRR